MGCKNFGKSTKIIVMNIVLYAILFIAGLLFPAAVHSAPAREGAASFTHVEGKEWMLAELRLAGKAVRIDRQKLASDNMAGVFSISFERDKAADSGRVSGMGAPNRYFGPYTAGANRSLRIGNLASTMMMAFKEPDELKEFDFFGYLSKVTRWDLVDGRLELYSAGAVLVFAEK